MSALDILRRVAQHRGVSIPDIRGPRRFAVYVAARHEAAYLMRQHTPMSYPDIGRALGNRDHTTALHGVRSVEAAAQLSEAYRDELARMVQVETFASACAREAA